MHAYSIFVAAAVSVKSKCQAKTYQNLVKTEQNISKRRFSQQQDTTIENRTQAEALRPNSVKSHVDWGITQSVLRENYIDRRTKFR